MYCVFEYLTSLTKTVDYINIFSIKNLMTGIVLHYQIKVSYAPAWPLAIETKKNALENNKNKTTTNQTKNAIHMHTFKTF